MNKIYYSDYLFIFADKSSVMLNDIIKNAGLFIILIGIIILVISFLNGITGNTGLIASFFLIIIGFLTFLLTNRYMEN
jgi:hypothetical protein